MARRARGFTLIELMVVVAIVGMLASIAIPTFQNFQLRSRQAERAIMYRSIMDAVMDYRGREGQYPTGDTSFNYLYAPYNPDYPPMSSKRPWRRNDVNWNKLSLMVDGGLYYSYYLFAYASTGYNLREIISYGDLDGGGPPYNYNYVYKYDYTWQGAAYRTDYQYDDNNGF
jgi:prepilin-type N-terminal cleavage/methylation domain-containing protein